MLAKEREGTTDLSKLNRNEAVRARPGRTETGTRVVDVEILEDGLRPRGKARRPHHAV